MKHAFKKVMALVLAIVMILGVMPGVFAAEPVCGFFDVQSTDWYATYVEYVVNHDPFLMNGLSATEFGPNETCTRAMAAVVLYRLADPVIPAVKPATFTDLTADWYKNGIAWAQQNGVVNGVTETTFEPETLVTREQLVTMIWRYAGSPKVEEDYLKDFPDAASVSAYARDAFNWAISVQIINGITVVGRTAYLKPQDNATRAQFAKIISVFDEATKPCTEHTWDEGKVSKEATCTEEGVMLYTCTRCGATKTEAIAALDHAWDEGKATKPATCTEAGEKTYTCTRCGATKTEEIPALGHKFVDGVCANCGEKLAEDGEVVIYYTNDVHTYIDKALSYDNIAELKKQTASVADGVALVDAGDHIQGTAYGGMDKGANIIKLMNTAGYDLATLGNHEFDYGMDRIMEIMAKEAKFDYVSANFYHEENGVKGDNVLDSYKILEVGGLKIAFVGITTPESFTKSTPKYFQDEAGKYIYGIAGGADGAELYASVQTAIDAAKAENPDYIIALGHLGDDPASDPWNSEDVIANVTGLDAFIDGHSHSTVVGKNVKDKAGKDVVLTQTGSYFDAVGRMSIKDGKVTTSLVTAFDGSDAATAELKNEWMTKVDTMLNQKIAESDIEFTTKYDNGKRAVRSSETNLGDLNADAYYWFVNENLDGGCDMAIMNGGGIRADAKPGDWTYKTCKTINTFGNVLCCIELSGQQILDALEFGSRFATGDSETMKENGGFLQVAGCTYEVNTYTPNTVKTDEKNVWQAGPDTYRVTNVKIYNKTTGTYEALDLTKTYRVAGSNYTLYDCGDGFNMFNGGKHVLDGISEDYLAMAAYVAAFKDSDENGYANITTANSPLASYAGYVMNYESKTGAGRIVMNTTAPVEPSENTYTLASSIKDGDQVVIYNPGHKRAIENNTDNHWYLMAADTNPVGNVFTDPADNIVWTVKVDENGNYSFVNGDNAITAWLSGTYVELTNVPTHDGACTTWKVEASKTTDKLFYISSTGVSTNYGAGYLECFLKKEVEKICGYASSNPTDNDFGFQFYVKGAAPVDPTEPTQPSEQPTEPTEPATGTEYVLTNELKDGDEVVVYNAGNAKAMPATAKGSYYLDGVDVTAADGKITTEDASIVWKVTKNEDGTYTFTNGDKTLSINWNTETSKTSITLDGANAKIALESCNAETNTFYMYSATQTGKYEHIYLEWFARYTEFSAYDTGAAKLTEKDFGFQFYVKSNGTVTPTEPTQPSTEPTQPSEQPTEPTEPAAGAEYVLTNELKDGDEVVVYNAGNAKAMPATAKGSYYLDGVDVTAADGKITTEDASIVWKVTKNEDGTYTFTNGDKTLSINWNTETSKTSITLDGANAKIALESCNAETNTFYMYSATQTGKYEHIYLEWFARYTEFSAYDTGAAKLTEKDFGFQFYVKGGTVTPTEPTEPTQPTEPSESTQPTEPSEPTQPTQPSDSKLVATDLKDIKDTDKVVIVISAPFSGKDYALLNTSAPTASATKGLASVFDGSEYTSEMIWRIVKVDGGYMIYAGDTDNYLVCATNTNNNLYTSASAADSECSIWNLHENGYLSTKQADGAYRFMGLYDNNGGKEVDTPNFRAYKFDNNGNMQSNIAGQTITFYVVKAN